LQERGREIAAGTALVPMDARIWLCELAQTYTMPEQHAVHDGKQLDSNQLTQAQKSSDITFF
jgi:methyl-accepting chemotaxis protein